MPCHLPFIDFHSHIVPDRFPQDESGEAGWPGVRHLDDGAAEIIIADRVFRRIDLRSWDVAARLKDMSQDGIDIQVLSPMPELLSYWFEPATGERICTATNDFILSMVNAAPDRFRGIGMVPLQDPERAAAMVPELRASGMIGVEIGSHVNAVPLGDGSLDPFYKAAEAEGLMLMVHALHPAGVDRIGAAPDMAAAAVFPLETALAATSLMANGVPDRFPGLKIMLCHGGGALSAILPRLDHAWRSGLSLSRTMPRLPSEVAREFYYDTLVYGQGPLALLCDTAEQERLVMGTDYPFAVMQPDPVAFLKSAASKSAGAIASGAAALLKTGVTPT